MIDQVNPTPFKPCAIIPVYNHHQVVEQTCLELNAKGIPVILVDDASDPTCARELQAIHARHPNITLLTHSVNRGKGGAVKTGLFRAFHDGFSHALQVDADGQHSLSDAEDFLTQAKANPAALILGYPAYDDSVPRLRYYARYLTHIWIWINTLSTDIRDSMCGFRVYPTAPSCKLLESARLGERMDFDPEFTVRWHWQQWPIVQRQTAVNYPADGLSHFRLWEDNTRISLMHARLFFGMLLRLPRLLTRSLLPPGATQ